MMRVVTGTRFSRVLLVVLALAIGFAAGSAFVAYGASSDTFNACVTSKGDIYRVRKNVSWSCLTGDTKISWNAQGPQGPQGIQGPQGVQGIQGLPGESAQTNVTIRSKDTTITANTFPAIAGLDCDDGETALAGAFQPDSVTAEFALLGDYPEFEDSQAVGWRFYFGNDADTEATGTMFVTCLAP